MKRESHSMVLVTCPKEAAETIAKEVLKKRVAACVNVVSEIHSLYWWEGEIDSSNESLLLIKTRTALLGSLQRVVKKVHPYKVPEIIAFPITHGNVAYLDWITKESTSQTAE
jgi:periplasmic divalent cation tolerance protein